MTLAAVWIESSEGGAPALCFASDSRTSPGPIEGVSKVALFGRGDLCAVWAGDYRYATLLVNHFDAFFTSSDAMRTRDVDVVKVLWSAGETARAHLDAAIKPQLAHFEIHAYSQEPEDTKVIVGGYSLAESAFMILTVYWDTHARSWKSNVRAIDSDEIVFIGDRGARQGGRRSARRIREFRTPAVSVGWHMEPLAVIDCRRQDRNRPTVGGHLQLAKAFRHGHVRAFAFRDAVTELATIRTVALKGPAAQEIESRGLLVDLANWDLKQARYARPNSRARVVQTSPIKTVTAASLADGQDRRQKRLGKLSVRLSVWLRGRFSRET